ncbi:hypothetical protein [Crocinitomix algicola]|uniref:hypothetical protein n=1 Tax=Crocinitomix algicola TaxID=1740263 RepID=UPI0009F6B6D2|nr:hypothetical protein [Crocinitomix algicola]
MINIKKLIYIALIFGLTSGSTSSIQSGKENHLAIGLFVGAHSNVITYAFVSTRNGEIIGTEVVRKDRFMFSALGHWPSIVNLKRENLLAKHQLDSCFLLQDEYEKVVGYFCPVFDDAWKVRYKEHPYSYEEFGWSHGQYRPSAAQREFLAKEYGVQNILTDYIYGDSLFKFLRDIRNESWVNAYSALASDPIVQGP